ncbi:hypothetical protein GCM10010300_04360 [Streptomyces olivaceoviridis]|nr:hypothetical protein GCM10010300_04360 [Streptomyces olivaceoviridis]
MGIAPGPVAAQAATACLVTPYRRTRPRDALGPVPATHRPTPYAVSAEAPRAGTPPVRARMPDTPTTVTAAHRPPTHQPTPHAVSAEAPRAGTPPVRARMPDTPTTVTAAHRPPTHRPTPRAVSAEAPRAGTPPVRARMLGALAVGAAVGRTGRVRAAHAQGGE